LVVGSTPTLATGREPVGWQVLFLYDLGRGFPGAGSQDSQPPTLATGREPVNGQVFVSI